MPGSVLNAVGRVVQFDLPGKRKVQHGSGVQLYRFAKADGSFDYDEYKKIQGSGNRKNTEQVWFIEDNIAFPANFVYALTGARKFGICHGKRRRHEQALFHKYLNCNVIGTEISPTAKNFPNTIEWDLHDVKPEWLASVDFIYGNSLDHRKNPERCLNACMSCIRKGGACTIELTSRHGNATRLEPFGAHLSVMPYLILKLGNPKYYVREILEAPSKAKQLAYDRFIVVQRF